MIPSIHWAEALSGEHTIRLVRVPDSARPGETVACYRAVGQDGTEHDVFWEGHEAQAATAALDEAVAAYEAKLQRLWVQTVSFWR